MSSLWSRYPILRSVSAYCLLYPGANFTQQCLLLRKKRSGDNAAKVDLAETARYFVYGGFIHGPIVHTWIGLAGRWFPGSNWFSVLTKVAVDQAVFAPIALSSFYIGLSTLEGKSAAEVYKEWRAKFPTTWAYGALVWPFIQAFNFRVIPYRNRTVFVGCMGFFWTTALSYWKSRQIDEV